MQTDKFLNLPVEPETEILESDVIYVGERECLLEKWRWDGVYAQSIVFLMEDVDALSDRQLIDLLISEAILKEDDKSYTLKRNAGGYDFINFNFSVTP